MISILFPQFSKPNEIVLKVIANSNPSNPLCVCVCVCVERERERERERVVLVWNVW